MYALRSNHEGRHVLIDDSGRRFVPKGLNHTQERRGDWTAAEADALVTRLHGWGFNTLGYDAPATAWTRMPFFATCWLTGCPHWVADTRTPDNPGGFGYDDVFDVRFRDRVEARVRAITDRVKRHANATCVGYFWTDTPQWDLSRARATRGTDWLTVIRSLPERAPGRRAYAAFLAGRYHDSTAIGRVYGVRATSADDLAGVDFPVDAWRRPGVTADDEAFLGVIAETLYRDTADAFARHDRGRLCFGERYKLHDHPDIVLKAAARFVDVISVQPGPTADAAPGQGPHETVFDAASFDRLHTLTGKPILVCDHNVSSYDEGTPVTLWHQSATPDGADAIVRRYVADALNRRYVLGHLRCQDRTRLDRTFGFFKQGYADVAPHASTGQR